MFYVGQIWTALVLMHCLPTLRGPEWRQAPVWSLAPGLLIMPFAFAYLQESPRWLLVNGKQTELETMLHAAALKNGKKLEDMAFDSAAHTPAGAAFASQDSIGLLKRLQMLFSTE